MARQAIQLYAIDPAHINDSQAIDRAPSNRLRIVSVCGGHYHRSVFTYDVVNAKMVHTFNTGLTDNGKELRKDASEINCDFQID